MLAILCVRIRTEKNGANQSVKLNPRLRIEPCTHGFRSGLSPRILWLQLSADRLPGPSGNFYFSVSFLYPSFFVSGRWPDLWDLLRLLTCFQFINLFIYFYSPATPPSSSPSSSLSQASSWKDSSPPSRLFASKKAHRLWSTIVSS